MGNPKTNLRLRTSNLFGTVKRKADLGTGHGWLMHAPSPDQAEAVIQQDCLGLNIPGWQLGVGLLNLFSQEATQEWEGPFLVLQVCGPLSYVIHCGPQRHDAKTRHINHLK